MADAFWTFSLGFYARPGVSAACIALQDGYGVDVDLVLFALWCASRGHVLSDAELAATDALVAGWRNSVVQPLRQARRALKPAPEMVEAGAASALRRQILTLELEAERIQQGAMEAQAPAPGTTARDAAAERNLAGVGRLSAIPDDDAALGVLLEAFA